MKSAQRFTQASFSLVSMASIANRGPERRSLPVTPGVAPPRSSHPGVIYRQATECAVRPREERAFWRRSPAARRSPTAHSRPYVGWRTRIAVRGPPEGRGDFAVAGRDILCPVQPISLPAPLRSGGADMSLPICAVEPDHHIHFIRRATTVIRPISFPVAQGLRLRSSMCYVLPTFTP